MSSRTSVIKDFHFAAEDFLTLLSQKKKKSSHDLKVLESFYDMVLSVVTKCDDLIQENRLLATNEHIKAKILEQELKKVYNTLYKKHPDTINDLIKQTSMPSKQELLEEIRIKNAKANG